MFRLILSTTKYLGRQFLYRLRLGRRNIMGLKNYFRANKPAAATTAAPAGPSDSFDPALPTAPGTSLELRPSPVMSGTSSRSSGMIDDIKHEVMVNYLYQQQCGHMWVNTMPNSPPQNSPRMAPDGAAMSSMLGMTLQEGVLLRKSRGNYLSCPPGLIGSPFEMACRALNVSVSSPGSLHHE